MTVIGFLKSHPSYFVENQLCSRIKVEVLGKMLL